MENSMTTFTVEDPKTGKKLYIPISNEDLVKNPDEIVQIISDIIEKTLVGS
jgi:hypothetical protein